MRIWRRPSAAERALRRTSGIGYWRRLDRRKRRRLRLSQALVALLGYAGQLRQDGRILAIMIRDILPAVLGTAALVAALEAVADALTRHLHWGLLFQPADPNGYGTMVGAAVGAEAVFLGLFYTTVGVIASTTYNGVPGEIRSLFVRERTSVIYVRSVTVALLMGLALLAMPLVSRYQPHVLTVAAFAVITGFSVLSLVHLGTGLFSFFDLSAISFPLRRRFLHAVRSAAASSRSIPGEVQQQAAHARAAEVLRVYGQLAELIRKRDVAEARAPERIALQLLGCWQDMAEVKPAIPSQSQWFSPAPRHPNWLTLGQERLSLALSTGAAIQPDTGPDPLWAEKLISRCLAQLLPVMSGPDGWDRAIRIVDHASELVYWLAGNLRIDEARLLCRTLTRYLREAVTTGPEAGSPDPGSGWDAFRLAIAEREVIVFTKFWLGLTAGMAHTEAKQVAAAFDDAVDTAGGPYRSGAPPRLLQQLEEFAAGIEFERRTERQRVTPPWWVHHVAGRTLSQILVTATTDFFDDVQEDLIRPLVLGAGQDAALETMKILSCLELVRKLAAHLPAARKSLAALDGLRHVPSDDELWPSGTLPDDVPAALGHQLDLKLAEAVPHLGYRTRDSAGPDLFGQGYRHLFNAAFQAILDEEADTARLLTLAVIPLADRARIRLSDDLVSERARNQAIFGSEPLIDMMELSGLAMLMSEVSPPGIWPEIKAFWDGVLSDDTAQARARQMSAALATHENLPALTSGSIGRTERKQALAVALSRHGITWPIANPIVAVFDSHGVGLPLADLADLFMAEYLKRRTDMDDLPMSRGAEDLRESIDRRRQQVPPESPDTDEGETE
jgi:hypothetical protein